MKKAIVFFFVLLTFSFTQNYSALADANPLVRIGIVQHFGKSSQDQIIIQTSDQYDKLELILPEDANSLDLKNAQKQITSYLSLKTAYFPVKHKDSESESARLIVGSYRTYETALYWAEKLKEAFPKENWRVVFPQPWQVWASAEAPQDLMQKLQKEGFNSAWIDEKVSHKKILNWLAKGTNEQASEEFQFNRRKLLVRSVSGKAIMVGNKLYKGTLEISPDSFGSYTIINELPLEEYLRGVIPLEIGADAPKAALETQAILARTYTLANLNRFLPDNYNLCATQHCQVYGGLSASNAYIDEVIQSTSGQVLRDKNGQIAQIFYYSTDGGRSASFADIWPVNDPQKVKQLKGMSTCTNLPDKFDLSSEDEARIFLTSSLAKSWNCYDAVSPAFRWEKQIEQSKLTETFKQARDKWKFAWPDFKQVKEISVTQRSTNGRALKLLVQTDQGQFEVERDEIRTALGGLKSSFFVIIKENNAKGASVLKIKGAGYGHGVGLSQYGARYLASQGVAFDKILKVYFPNYDLGKL